MSHQYLSYEEIKQSQKECEMLTWIDFSGGFRHYKGMAQVAMLYPFM